MLKKLFLFILLAISCSVAKGQIYINEIMSNNQTGIQDPNLSYSDWIEIYNNTNNTVNLNNYSLSDNPDSLRRWVFPFVNIGAHQFLRVWCSGISNISSSLQLSTNFSIDANGETIYLSDPAGNIIDNIPAVYTPGDISYGRLPDGSLNLGYLSAPTPGATNNAQTIATDVVNIAPVFSLNGGFYTTPQTITLSHPDPNVTIRYTLDGSEPTASSTAYTGPFTIQSRAGDPNYYSLIRTSYQVHFFLPDWNPPAGEVFKCNVIRARAFKNGSLPGPIETHSYFIDPNIFTRYGNLAVVSLVSDPKHLFDPATGIYVPGDTYQPGTYLANYYLPWDRPANIEMFLPSGAQVFNSGFRININGQSSPSNPQKGINVNASSDFGISKVDYPLFESTNSSTKYITGFKRFKLRAWGSDRGKGLFRDAYCNSFFNNTNLDVEAYRPIVVFINGEYWGLQEMRERNREENYYEDHYLIDRKNPGFDILEGGSNTVLHGDSQHWDAMINFINSNNLSNQNNYEYVKTQMDVNSFMLSYMSSIYFARSDWPDQNEAKWRPRTPGGKWKWIQWDMDNTTAYYLNPWYDMFNQAINGNRGYGPSDLLDALLANDEFRYNFVNLFADWMNTSFLPQLAQSRVDNMRAELQPYMTEFQNRWQLNYNWTNQTDSMKWWMGLRPQFIQQQIQTYFGATSVKNLTLDVSDTAKGFVTVNTIRLDNNTPRITPRTYPWTGQYFQNIPVPITATAKPGYRFLRWMPMNDTTRTIYLNLNNNRSITAEFDIDPNYVALRPPVINEVMSSNFSTIADENGSFEDWIEIYNPNNDTLDLGGYYITDNLVLPTRYQFKAGNDSLKIPPYGHLLVWLDNDTVQGCLHTNFKINATGDFLALFDRSGERMVDSITIPASSPDISFGRRTDGSVIWKYFNPTTPRRPNWTAITNTVYINELQTINTPSGYADNYGEHDQWVELYNSSADTVDLAGWFMSTDQTRRTQFPFGPDNDSTKILPFGHKIVWADNQNQGVLHANFTLNTSGGCATLIKPDYSSADSVCWTNIAAGSSYGRVTDGNSAFMLFTIPTADSNNVDLTSFINSPIATRLKLYPNPVHNGKLYLTNVASFTVIDMTGKAMETVASKRELDVTGYSKGIYVMKFDDGSTLKFVVN